MLQQKLLFLFFIQIIQNFINILDLYQHELLITFKPSVTYKIFSFPYRHNR